MALLNGRIFRVAILLALLALISVASAAVQTATKVTRTTKSTTSAAVSTKPVQVKTSPQLTMMTLSAATMKFSPVVTSTYFTSKSPAYTFLLNNLKARNIQNVTFFYPTDEALKKYQSSLKNRPVNCPVVEMRNHLAQQMVPGRYTAKDLRRIMYRVMLNTMSPVKLSIFRSKQDVLQVGLLNNGYPRVISQANIVKPNAMITRGFVLHLVDTVLDICI